MTEAQPREPAAQSELDAAPRADENTLLLEFVRARDVPCPKCGYNLRNLTRPKCPECGEPLHLKVGTPRVRFALFLLTVTPGLFSSVAAGMVSGALLFTLLFFDEVAPWNVWAVDAFGWLSGLSTLLLYRRRDQFLRQSAKRQWVWVVGVWVVHILAFVGYVFSF